MSVPDPFAEFDTTSQSDDSFTEFDDAKPLGSQSDLLIEPLKKIASDAVGAVGAGYTEMAMSPFVGMDEAIKTGESIQQTASEFGEPQTQVGDWGVQTLGDIGQLGIDFGNYTMGQVTAFSHMLQGKTPEEAQAIAKKIEDEGYFNVLGDNVLETTGSPFLATGAKMLPEIVGAGVPISKAWMNRPSAIQANKIKQRLIDGDTSGELAQYTLDGSGKLKSDSVALDAINIGYDQGLLMANKGLPEPEGIGVLRGDVPEMNPTRAKMLEMLAIKKRGLTDTFWGDQNRPSAVAGRSLSDRLQHIISVNRDAGNAIDIEANNLKGKPVDFSQPVDSFMQSLDSMGIKFNPKTGKVKFKGSDIEGLKGDELAVKRVLERMLSGERGAMPDAYDLHKMKRYLDNNLSYGQNNAKGGMTSQTERMLKKLRREIDSTLDGQFEAYDKANTAYADTIGVIDEAQRLAGQKTDLSGANIDTQLGVLMKRMLGNNQSTSHVVDSVGAIDDMARKYGGTYDDNIRMLVSHGVELDKIFGNEARAGFQGGIENALSATFNKMTDSRSMSKMAIDAMRAKLTPEQANSFDIIERAIRGEKPDYKY